MKSAGSTEGPLSPGPGRSLSGGGGGGGGGHAPAATATGSCGAPAGGATRPASSPLLRRRSAESDRWRIEHFSSFGDFRGFSVNRRPAPARIDLRRRQPSLPSELTAPLRLCTPLPRYPAQSRPRFSIAAREGLGRRAQTGLVKAEVQSVWGGAGRGHRSSGRWGPAPGVRGSLKNETRLGAGPRPGLRSLTPQGSDLAPNPASLRRPDANSKPSCHVCLL